jgi:hypothetical protein
MVDGARRDRDRFVPRNTALSSSRRIRQRGWCHTPNFTFQPLNSCILAVILPGDLDGANGKG